MESLGEILEGRGKEEKGKGEGKRGGKRKERQGRTFKKWKMNRKRREIIMEAER